MNLVHLFGFITKKFIKMHGHMDVKFMYGVTDLYTTFLLLQGG